MSTETPSPWGMVEPVDDLRPSIYGRTVTPSHYTDPQCLTCKGTGVTGPYGRPRFTALVPRGERDEQGGPWWEPCVPCGVARLLNQRWHRPGKGMRVVIVEALRRGPTYEEGHHTHIRAVEIYAHDGARWLPERDCPSPFAVADWHAPAGEIVTAIYPGAEIVDGAHSPQHDAVPVYRVTLTHACQQEACADE